MLIVSLGFLFYGFGMVLETAFNGAGDTVTPTYLNLCIFWLFEIPLAYVLAYHFGLEEYGVFWAITIAFSVLAVAAAVLFRRGKWKTKMVLILTGLTGLNRIRKNFNPIHPVNPVNLYFLVFNHFKFKMQFFAAKNIAQIMLPKFSRKAQRRRFLI